MIQMIIFGKCLIRTERLLFPKLSTMSSDRVVGGETDELGSGLLSGGLLLIDIFLVGS